VNPKQLVVDQALHQVEDAPAGEEQPEVHPPRRRQVAAPPGPEQKDRGGRDEDPRRQVEQPVDEGVRLEPRDGIHPLAAVVTREHVVPLEDLVEDDAVDEAPEPEPQHKGGRRRGARPRGMKDGQADGHRRPRLPGAA
jgi:hypothetical protein